jgi:hypothetical protein
MRANAVKLKSQLCGSRGLQNRSRSFARLQLQPKHGKLSGALPSNAIPSSKSTPTDAYTPDRRLSLVSSTCHQSATTGCYRPDAASPIVPWSSLQRAGLRSALSLMGGRNGKLRLVHCSSYTVRRVPRYDDKRASSMLLFTVATSRL